MCAAIAGMLSFTSCGSDDDNNLAALLLQQQSLTNTFSVPVDGASYVPTEQPTNVAGPSLGQVSYNSHALAGGSNYMTIQSAVPYTEFYVGLSDQTGYYAIPAESVLQPSEARSEVTYTYIIVLNYSVNYNRDVAIQISGKQEDGTITKAFEAPVVYEVTATGALSLNLTFDNPKDVDLHLIMPDGTEYYYGNRGYVVNGNEEEVRILDHDSNAMCNIDNLNNENIVVPLNIIQKGEYTVKVNMYSNCYPHDRVTNWDLVVRYKGVVITPTFGTNPTNGTYPVDASSGDHTTVMKFFINEGLTVEQAQAMKSILRPMQLDIMADMKLEEASWK